MQRQRWINPVVAACIEQVIYGGRGGVWIEPEHCRQIVGGIPLLAARDLVGQIVVRRIERVDRVGPPGMATRKANNPAVVQPLLECRPGCERQFLQVTWVRRRAIILFHACGFPLSASKVACAAPRRPSEVEQRRDAMCRASIAQGDWIAQDVTIPHSVALASLIPARFSSSVCLCYTAPQ